MMTSPTATAINPTTSKMAHNHLDAMSWFTAAITTITPTVTTATPKRGLP
jgi:hypothetical protein